MTLINTEADVLNFIPSWSSWLYQTKLEILLQSKLSLFQAITSRSVAPVNAIKAYIKRVKQSRYRPGVAQEVKVPRFHDNGTG